MRSFIFKIKPHPKGRPRFGRGHAYTDANTRKYEEALGLIMKRGCPEGPWTVPVSVELDFVFDSKEPYIEMKVFPAGIKDYPKSDVDNLAKAVFDAANKIVWADDKQVVAMSVTKRFIDKKLIGIKNK